MSAINAVQGSSAQLSLANNASSGTTFAAKARAAELNAARARRASKEPEESEVPSSTPVSLAALTKFTRARNKGKAWKPFNLNEGNEVVTGGLEGAVELDELESSIDNEVYRKNKSEEVHGGLEFFRDEVNDKNPHLLRHQLAIDAFSGTDPDTAFSSDPRAFSNTQTPFDVNEWDPNLPPGPTTESSISPAPSPERLQQHASVNDQAYQGGALSVDTILPPGQEAKLALLGVLPPVSRDPSKQPLPFVGARAEAPNQNYQIGNNMQIMESQNLGAAYQFDPNSRRFPGPMNFDFRFPAQYDPYQYHHYQQFNQYEQPYVAANPHVQTAPYAQDGYNYQAAYGVTPANTIEGASQHQSFYGLAPTPNKRDILLKSLHDVVESSRARESSRTVLYDPIAQSEPPQTHPTKVDHTAESSKSEHEVLEDSEPLPGWKSRPVDIHHVLTPVMTNSELAALSKLPTSDISSSQPGGSVKSRVGFSMGSTVHSLDRQSMIKEAEEWWKTDRRGNGELRKYLNRIAEDDRMRKQLKAGVSAMELGRQPENPIDSWAEASGKSASKADSSAGAVSNPLLIEVLANFHGYLAGPPEAQRGQFGSFGTVPEWCIDKGLGGSTSFFGEDWGAPPPRVGRDPRYRPMLHEPRYTLYEELERRGNGGEIYGRRFR